MYLAAAFLVAAAFFAIFGFGEVVSAFAEVARKLFWFALLACVVAGLLHLQRRRT